MKPVLHEQEHIRDTYHQSLMVLFRPLLISSLILIVPWYFAIVYNIVPTFRIPLLVLSIGAIVHAIRSVTIWHLNSYVVTNKRLLKMSHEGLFKRTVVETPHERILNVSYKTTGLFSVLFHYGDVEVQVVGLVDPLILKNIPHPAEVKDYIWQLHTRVVTTQGTFAPDDMAHVQERVGYTKKNQRII